MAQFEPLCVTLEKAFNVERITPRLPDLPPDCSHQLSMWRGSHKKSLKERQDDIQIVYPQMNTSLLNDGGLPLDVADNMIENCIGSLSLPLGIAPNFVVNNQHLIVPMCIEEPSVIAACSSMSKLVAKHGGFFSDSTDNIMTGQIQIMDVKDASAAVDLINSKATKLIPHANTFCASMKRRGGGVVAIHSRVVHPRIAGPYGETRRHQLPYVVVHLDINVCESMGANIINTVAEGIAPVIADMVEGRVGLRILTNMCAGRRARSEFRIPVKKMGWKGMKGEEVCDRIIEAYQFALDDPFRATTNNKGVMNGMDAISIATGQDWRAGEASAHAYAAKDGFYGPMAHYTIEEHPTLGNCLVGQMELPIAVGTQGGAVRTHPVYRFSLDLLGNPTSRFLSQIIVSVGLAQNFGAIRALAVEGIQKGHMALHAKNIASAAGVAPEMVPEVAHYMVARNSVKKHTAVEYLEAHNMFVQVADPPRSIQVTPSIFSVNLEPDTIRLTEPLSLNVAFVSLGNSPVHISIAQSSDSHELHQQLLGDAHGLAWLADVYAILDRIKLSSIAHRRSNSVLQSRLKLISILLNVIANQLVVTHPQETFDFLDAVLHSENRRQCLDRVPGDTPALLVGFPLILALWQVFERQVEAFVKAQQPVLAEVLLDEQRNILTTIYNRPKLKQELARVKQKNGKDKYTMAKMLVDAFMREHGKRWQATMILLCDALSIGPINLTPKRLELIRRFGEYFEFEGTISHDVSRFTRDRDRNDPNVYQVWLDAVQMQPSDETLRQFMKFVDDTCLAKRDVVLKDRQASFFNANEFFLTSTHIRRHYGIPPAPYQLVDNMLTETAMDTHDSHSDSELEDPSRKSRLSVSSSRGNSALKSSATSGRRHSLAGDSPRSNL